MNHMIMRVRCNKKHLDEPKYWIDESYHCVFCPFTRENFETYEHLFVTCPYFSEVRNFVDFWINKVCGRVITLNSLNRLHLG